MEDIFKDAKFGNRFACVENGREDDCVFLEKMDFGDNCPPMYKLARQTNVKYKDGGKKSFSAEIIADKDGFQSTHPRGVRRILRLRKEPE